MIKNLVFDLDGTLFDNRIANVEAYVKAFDDAGSPIKHEDYNRHFGLRFDALVEQLAPHLDEQQRALVRERKKYHYQQSVHLITPNQPLIDFLIAMHPIKRTGLATTASRHNVEFILDYFSLLDAFDVIICGEDVLHGKPDPECYNNCIKVLGGKAEETLIFEDSQVGIQAAVAAGAQVIQVTPDEI